MRATRAPDKQLVHELNELISHDQIGVDLCELAIERGYAGDDPQALLELRDDHCRHVKSVMLLIESMGASTGDAFRVVVSRDLLTTEIALFEALYLNSVRAHARYHGLLNRRDLPVRLRGVLSGNLANERYHAAWLERRLQLAHATAAGASAVRLVSRP